MSAIRCGGVVLAGALLVGAAEAPSPAPFPLRGKTQSLRLYGARGGPAALVSSGDGGWIHLGPEVAEILADHGYFVVGFDVKAYLSAFTTRDSTLSTDDVRRDYRALVDYTRGGGGAKPVLVGASEGAGLSVLAATDAELKAGILGVIGLGLPDRNELGWRFRDSVIYLTKKAPKEPSFSTAEIIAQMSPLPLALIQSSHDEFVPRAETDSVFAKAGAPKRLWMIEAGDHRFSNARTELGRCLREALQWIDSSATGPR